MSFIRPRPSVSTFALSLALLSMTCGGCGRSDTPVGPKLTANTSGKVSYNGQPVKNAIINFSNPKIGSYGTQLKDDGTYDIPKMAEGDFLVTVNPVNPPMAMTPPKDGKLPTAPERLDIPKKYRTAVEGMGKAIIKAGANTHDLDMKN